MTLGVLIGQMLPAALGRAGPSSQRPSAPKGFAGAMLWEAIVPLVLDSAGVGAPQHVHHLRERRLLPDASDKAHRCCSLLRHIPLQCSQPTLSHARL